VPRQPRTAAVEFGWRTIDSDATAHGGQRRPAGSGRSRGLSRGGLGPAEVRPDAAVTTFAALLKQLRIALVVTQGNLACRSAASGPGSAPGPSTTSKGASTARSGGTPHDSSPIASQPSDSERLVFEQAATGRPAISARTAVARSFRCRPRAGRATAGEARPRCSRGSNACAANTACGWPGCPEDTSSSSRSVGGLEL